MLRSTRKNVLIFVVVTVVGLPFAYFFASPFDFWKLIALFSLAAIGWSVFAVVTRADKARFGASMTLYEILKEQDPVRMVQLLRYHLGWSPSKIARELNQRGIRNYGLPWRESDVRRIMKSVRRGF